MNNDYRPENENGGQTPGVSSDSQQYSYRSDSQNGGNTQNQNNGAQNGGYNAPGGSYNDQNQYYYQNNGYDQNRYGNQNGYGYQQNQYGYPGYVDESGLLSENKLKRLNGVSAKVTIGDWLRTDCISLLNLIPFFGSIAALVLYCILAFSSKTAVSLKTRYQANLIWAGIVLALYIVLIIILVAAGVSIGGMIDNIGSNY